MRKILVGISAVALAVASVPLFAAFEAHVINVTARIENALRVDTTPIKYGTVFPEERLDKSVVVSLSGSFLEEPRVDDVNYILRQKPKCGITSQNGQVLDENSTGTGEPKLDSLDKPYIDCGPPPRATTTGEFWGPLPLLCPYLSKHPIRSDNDPSTNDGSVNAFHQIGQWVNKRWVWNDVPGRLAKSENDIVDLWNLDLVVPCFRGQCAQDNVVPPEYQADPADAHKIFGCNLWIEVTGVSRVGDTQTVTLENKSESGGVWTPIIDGTQGTLTFALASPTFDYSFSGQGLQANTSYSLIYYADPWEGDNPGAFIASGVSDGSGNLALNGSTNLGIDLPTLPDANFAIGAKIWLVTSSDYNPGTKMMTAWNPANYLFEMVFIHYNDTDN